jgi:hypothetical protein
VANKRSEDSFKVSQLQQKEASMQLDFIQEISDVSPHGSGSLQNSRGTAESPTMLSSYAPVISAKKAKHVMHETHRIYRPKCH